MAESSLSIGFSDLKSEVGYFLGHGRSSWAAAVETKIEGLVQSGVRLVYYPPAISEELVGHEWTWLAPSAILNLVAPYATGTITIVDGVVTLVDGVFPSWAAQGDVNISGGIYTVNTRDGDTQVTLDDTSVDADALTEYGLTRKAYDLPDDFNRLKGMLHYPADEYRDSALLVSISMILQLRAGRTLSGPPHWFATRYKTSTGADGQRQEMLLYPDADQAWMMHYEYEAYSGKLSASFPYPLGGSHLAELYIESCLSVAEKRINQEVGIHTEQYTRLLVDAITRDNARDGRNFGQMGHKEKTSRGFRRGWTAGTYPITYNGVSIP